MTRWRPESCCPICGRSYKLPPYPHRCSRRVLAAINAAHTRAEQDDSVPVYEARSYAQRLAEGFRLLHAAYEE